jgi:predicted RNA-binding protein with PUA-like domain
MRDMQLGDRVLFYHSSVDPPAVAGTAVVAREAYADHTAWDPKDDHYDPKASPDNPIWQMVDIKLEEIFAEPVPIGVLRSLRALGKMELLKTGSRLSVQPVRPAEFEAIVNLAYQSGRGGAAVKRSKPRAAAKPKKKAGKRPKARKKSSRR